MSFMFSMLLFADDSIATDTAHSNAALPNASHSDAAPPSDDYINAVFANAAHELAEKIMPAVDPSEDIGFLFRSLASLGTKEVAVAREAIMNELHGRGLKLSNDSQSTLTITVTLSESFQQLRYNVTRIAHW